MDLQSIEIQKAIGIIQARSSSTRLPNKVLKPLAGKPMIWHIVRRTEACKNIDEVVVATSTDPSDDPLAEFCEREGIRCFRGSLTNVMSRYLAILENCHNKYVARITGDCPLIHPAFIDRQIELLNRYQADIIQLVHPSSLLVGQAVYSSESLKKVGEISNHPDDLEHVGSRYFHENQELFRIVKLQVPQDLRGDRWRITVDEEKDYELLAIIYDCLYQGKPIQMQEVVEFLKSCPGIACLNHGVVSSPINHELKIKRLASLSTAIATECWQASSRLLYF